MLELVHTAASVVTAVASPRAIDAAMDAPGTYRVAPDELMAIGEPDPEGAPAGGGASLIGASVLREDPDALVVDASDGWTVWSLRGATARLAFTYMSSLELPQEGFIQGDVAHVPVRVVVAEDLLHLLVPAMSGAYLRDRLLERCRVLRIREVTEAAP